MSEKYFEMLRDGLDKAYTLASEARSKGLDPSDEIEVKIAKDVAARVEGIVGPPGIAERIRAMEKEGMAREDIAFEIARKIAAGEVYKDNREKLIEQAVRTGVGILTEGVLVAPTEGISKVKIKQNPDGSDYVAVYYAGPIRSAGGTAAALSLVLADIARKAAGVGNYRATDSQIERYVEEINVYEARVTHLQYMPPEKDIRHIIKNCPVCIDGDPTEEIEVSAYRGVPGVETDRVRGGVPLVSCEGVALKSAKLFKYTKKLKLGWDWLEDIIKIKKKADKIEIKPDKTYLDGLVAGRPVFSHASAKGGFRLRYGRSRTTGLMSKDIHPATMILVDGFLAYGTHMKIERPGKGCVIATHEGIEPPVVKLKDGSVMKVHTQEEAESIKSEIAEVLFLGDMLMTYGDFLKSNHPLLPSGYCVEWWAKELEEVGVVIPPAMNAQEAFEFSKSRNVPLHPDHTHPWHDVTPEQLRLLVDWLKTGTAEFADGTLKSFTLPILDEQKDAKRILEELLIEHRVADGKVVLSENEAFSTLTSLGMLDGEKISSEKFDAEWIGEKTSLELVNLLSGILIKAKAPTYIGARMGRPEKAKERKMEGSPHVMFPTGSFKNRSLMKIYRSLKAKEGEKTINLEVSRFKCPNCNALGFYRRCEVCKKQAKQERVCQKCGATTTYEVHCDRDTVTYDRRPVNIIDQMDDIKSRLGFLPEDVKGVRGLSNATKIPERLEKGFLRAKHNIFVFRDGTCRFDATDVTLTHFIPDEIGTSLERLKELGYEKDYLGNPLVRGDQIVPLRHQDIILADTGAEYFVRVAKFIDEMLVNLYGLRPFYNVNSKHDLIGHLGVGLSPHTSAGALCRIIGFTRAHVGYGHPYFHTVKRRNCFHPYTEIVIWDASRKRYLKRNLGEIAEETFEGNPDGIKQLDPDTIRVNAPEGLHAFSIDPKSHNTILKKIKYFIKAKKPKKWIKITTSTHREMIVTPDHNILISKDGNLTSLEAKEIEKGMDIPVCLKLNSPLSGTSEINIAEAFCELGADEKEAIRIRSKEFFKELYYKNRQLIHEKLPLTANEIRCPLHWYSSVPISHFEMLVRNNVCSYDDLPRDARIAPKRDNMTLPSRIPINESLMLILGYFVAEGYTRKSRSCYQVNFRICNKRMLSKLLAAIDDVFGKKPYLSENNTQVAICSRVIHLLFTKIFKTGSAAKSKRIPSMLFSLSDELVKSFISAYFDGDGSVIASPPRMRCYSISQKLLEDIGTLLLRFGIFCRYGKTKPRLPGKKVLERYKELGKMPKRSSLGYIYLCGCDISKFADICRPSIKHKIERMTELRARISASDSRSIMYEGRKISLNAQSDYLNDKVSGTEEFSENVPSYCLDVDGNSLEEKNVLLNNQIFTIRCDGDEDCVMLLMDSLLNFSRKYLNEKRGGTMDAPLVLSLKINPKEVDDEVYCMEFVSSYPLEFYQAAERITPPGDVKLKTVKDVLGRPEQYESMPLTHPGGLMDKGVIRTAYVELQSIPDKIEAEFSLQAKLRAVDSKDAAERLIMNHFIPDLYGNLRSYSRQTFRCVSCNTIYRRPPLAGKCSKCGGNLLLTINKGGIEKYLHISRDIAERFDLPDYLKQRLKLFEKELDSIFEDDKIKQTGLSDFL